MRTPSIQQLTFVTVVLLLWAGYFVFGPRHGLDSGSYVRFGNILIEWITVHFPNGLPMRNDVLFPNYIIPSLFIAIPYHFFGQTGHQIIIGLNILLFANVVRSLVAIWQNLEIGSQLKLIAPLLAALLLTHGLLDVPLWVYYDLSDIIFLFIVMLVASLSIEAVVAQRNRLLLMALAIALLAFFARPTAIILPILCVAFFTLRINPNHFGWVGWLSIICATLFTIGVVLGMPLLIETWVEQPNFRRQIPAFLSQTIRQSAFFYQNGWVVADRPETFFHNPSGYLDYLLITLKRLAYYFIPLREGYSLRHNLLNCAYFLVVGYFYCIGIRHLWSLDPQGKRLIIVLVFFTLLFGLMHAITLNSYDWRYQLPAMIPFWILAGIGLLNTPRIVNLFQTERHATNSNPNE